MGVKPQHQKTQSDFPMMNMIKFLSTCATCLLLTLAGTAGHGELFLVAAYVYKAYYGYDVMNEWIKDAGNEGPIKQWLRAHQLAGWHWFVWVSILVSVVIYYPLGAYLQHQFYNKRRHEPEKWKCQPDRFLSSENEKHEIMLGSFNLIIGGTLSGTLVTYIANGGFTTLYFQWDQYGIPWLLASIPIVFMYEEAAAYYIHRAFHQPFLYKNFHKMHHRYGTPTCFSATAIHPIEFIILQSSFLMPVFFMPIFAPILAANFIYMFYFRMVDHSGIMWESIFPWQPHSITHDDHHKYFHTNFGFNMHFFDWLHGTDRKDGRVYTETTYGGFGDTSKNARTNGVKAE